MVKHVRVCGRGAALSVGKSNVMETQRFLFSGDYRLIKTFLSVEQIELCKFNTDPLTDVTVHSFVLRNPSSHHEPLNLKENLILFRGNSCMHLCPLHYILHPNAQSHFLHLQTPDRI